MTTNWPMVPLGQVVKQCVDRCTVQADAAYPNFGIYSFGRGLFRKQPINGAASSATTLYRARAGQFVYSRLFAFEGAYGVVAAEFDGSYVSNEFPLFDCDLQQVTPTYLGWLFRVPRTWDEVAKLTTGMGDRRRRVKPEHLVTYKIPLPPLPEQRRIVAKIDQLAANINEARALRRRNTAQLERLLIAMAHRPDLDPKAKRDLGWNEAALGELITQVEDCVAMEPAKTFPNFGIFSFGRGLFAKPPIDGLTTSARVLNRVHAGQFIYSRLFAFEGSYGVVPPDFDGCFVSNEYPTFNCDFARVNPEFLFAYFKSPSVWAAVAVGSKGLGDRRQRVKPEQLLSHRLLLPPLKWQHKIKDALALSYRLKELQAATAAELDALLPAILDRAFKGDL